VTATFEFSLADQKPVMGLSVPKYSSERKSMLRQYPVILALKDLEISDPDPDPPSSDPVVDRLMIFHQLCIEVDADWEELNNEIWVSWSSQSCWFLFKYLSINLI
jgi:hypothetical protein